MPRRRKPCWRKATTTREKAPKRARVERCRFDSRHLMLMIVYAKLCDYITDSRKTVKALWAMGASREMIQGSYIRQSLAAAAAAAALPAAGSTVLFLLATESAAQRPSVSPSLICAYLAVSAVTAFAFVLPVYRSIKAILERKEASL